MFDPLLELKRRRMMGVPQVTGNLMPPDVGPDIQAAPVTMPAPMQMQAPVQTAGPDFGGLAELGAMRGMNLLMKKMRTSDGEAGAKVMAGLPVLSKLFRR